ncbi:MAG TPA: ABC transporter ATP-binding protein [Candidatus Bathyarchaeia archaeon]|nr:ABC transporter ATP-binding protein [Candidatus Bathyarchaeia archaeon]
MRGEVKAVDDVSFEVQKGDAIGLAGESGCGKTSAALSILKLLPWNGKIYGGNIRFGGEEILKMPPDKFNKEIRWKKISVVFQGAMNALHPNKSIGSQIAEPILAHEDVSKDEARKRTERLLDLVGIGASKFARYPHELSGGMKQRSMISMALACNPTLVIADEPTTALDVIIEAQVLKVMKELQKKLDLSLILISHDLSMIADTCNKVAIMYAGKIAEYGESAPLYKEPLHPYTQKLIGAFPSILGVKRELQSIPGFPPDLLNPPPGCRFHPRCPYAMDICKRKEPEVTEVDGSQHLVACHLVGK